MGGGNGLKSHMAQQRNLAKSQAEGKGGGGSKGKEERTASKIAVTCGVCKTVFQSAKMKTQLKEHWETKHSKVEFGACFPGVTL